MRVAYTLEQCWHRVPGGTGVAALRTAEAMAAHEDVRLIGVAGRHHRLPPDPWLPPIPVERLALRAPWLYETWLRFGWPKVERATGPVDVTHSTTLIPAPTKAPLIVTLHDLAFLHTPEHFTKHGNRVFRQSLRVIKRRADLVLCCSEATLDDSVRAGIDADRLRLVPLGVETATAGEDEVQRVRGAYDLPDEFVLFVGTVEPRKNLAGLIRAMALLPSPLPLVVAGADGWGDGGTGPVDDRDPLAEAVKAVQVRMLGFVPADDLTALYAAATVFAYPSHREGYGLPVLEAMAQGVPVVTSRGTATEETAGAAAVLVDPASAEDIARGIDEALRRRAELSTRGRARALRRSWSMTAALTAQAYRDVAR